MSTKPEEPTEIDKLHRHIWKLEVENLKLREDKEKLEQENERLMGLLEDVERVLRKARSWIGDARKLMKRMFHNQRKEKQPWTL